jgi:hypothetical protein
MDATNSLSREQALFTRLTNDNGLLTKRYRLAADGSLHKDTHALLTRGLAEILTADNVSDLAETIALLAPNQALTYGVPQERSTRIVTKDAVYNHPGTIARSREYFSFRSVPAFLMLDHDADHVERPIASAEELRNAIISACPALVDAPMLWTASASSCIERTDSGQGMTGLRGQRLYILVADGTDIPRAGDALYERLWLAGFGSFVVAKNGKLLDRNLIDSSVFEPERIDFAAGAECEPPLRQHRPYPVWWNDSSTPFDSRKIAALTNEEREIVRERRKEARAAKAEESARVRGEYLDTEAKVLAKSRGIDLDCAREIIADAVDNRLLFGDFLLLAEAGESVTVGEVLDNPARWHGERFADPIEPTYRDDRRVAWANLRSGGRPYLWSHAHGGRQFRLLRQPTKLRLQPGEEPRLADEVLAILRAHGELFDFGEHSIARIAHGRVIIVEHEWLRDHIGRLTRFERFDKRSNSWQPASVPEWLSRTILARVGERDLPKLTGVITAPVMREDGSILDVPGFDAATGLLYACDVADTPRVATHPTYQQLRAAFAELWKPFARFPFVDDVSRGVMVATLLTSAIRAALPTAPGTVFEAPAAGSGKTLLAKCVAWLGGQAPVMTTQPENDAEARKRLFAELRGGASNIVWDNVTRPIEGDALNAFLTAPVFSDRILGVSEKETLPNRALFVATGNNITIVGDTCRRLLVCRIDAQTEWPFQRAFDFDPESYIRDHRQRLVHACLTILRGYVTDILGEKGEGIAGSFEAWDRLVRQAVILLGVIGVGVGLGDPYESARRNVERNPSAGVLDRMLVAWRDTFGAAQKTAGEVWKEAYATLEPEGSVLRAAIEDIAPGDKHFSARRLAGWLQKHKEQISGGLRFVEGERDTHRKSPRWMVVES